MTAIRSPDQQVAALAARQHGVLAHDQVIRSGLSQHQIDRRVRHGTWRRAALATYVVAGSPDTWRQRAWVAALAVGDEALALSFLTAGAIHGLCSPSPLPHVSVSRTTSVRCRIAVVHRIPVPACDRIIKDGLPCTSASRTLVDLAGVLEGTTYLAVVDDALCRRLTTPASVLETAGRFGCGCRGIGRVRAAVAAWTDSIAPDSVAEARLIRSLRELGVDGIVTQHEVRDEVGRFVARLDLAVPGRRRALEYDGVVRHGPNAWARDEPRYQRLRALGWDVESVTKLDLLPGEPRLRRIARQWAA